MYMSVKYRIICRKVMSVKYYIVQSASYRPVRKIDTALIALGQIHMHTDGP